MRKNSQNERRNRYNRILAAARACDVVVCGRTGKPGATVVVVEAEDVSKWDDILELRTIGGVEEEHRWQVKRQSTPLGEDEFLDYVGAIDLGKAVTHHFAVPQNVEVDNVGTLRVLRDLSGRASQLGASSALIVPGLTKEETSWVKAIAAKCTCSDQAAVERVGALRVHFVGLEEDIAEHAQAILAPLFGRRTKQAWETILAFVADTDGVVEVTWPILEKSLQPLLEQGDDPINDLYRTFIREVEVRFWLKSWPGLSDYLVRNIVPIAWLDDVRRLTQLHNTTAWPGKHSNFEAALDNVVTRANQYMDHFLTNAEETDSTFRENKGYKRVYPNPKYDEALENAKEWDRQVQCLLNNMVVALNEFAQAVRSSVDSTHRLMGGILAIHDSLGTRANGNEGVYWVPSGYVDWD